MSGVHKAHKIIGAKTYKNQFPRPGRAKIMLYFENIYLPGICAAMI